MGCSCWSSPFKNANSDEDSLMSDSERARLLESGNNGEFPGKTSNNSNKFSNSKNNENAQVHNDVNNGNSVNHQACFQEIVQSTADYLIDLNYNYMGPDDRPFIKGSGDKHRWSSFHSKTKSIVFPHKRPATIATGNSGRAPSLSAEAVEEALNRDSSIFITDVDLQQMKSCAADVESVINSFRVKSLDKSLVVNTL